MSLNPNQVVAEGEPALRRLAALPSVARRSALRQLHAQAMSCADPLAAQRALADLARFTRQLGALAALASCLHDPAYPPPPSASGIPPATAYYHLSI